MQTCPHCGQSPGSRWFCRRCGAALHSDPPEAIAQRASRRRRVRRWLLGAGAGFVTLCLALLIAAALKFNPAALGLSVLAAFVPAMLYSWLVLRLDRYEKEPRRAILGAFAWGAVGAVVLALILETITGGILMFAIKSNAASFVSSAIGAPLIEETTKGVALLALLIWYRDEFDNVLDGLIYGALIGLGFAMTENTLYFGSEYLRDGAHGLGRLFIARVVISGFGHAVYTATTGAAVGWSREMPAERRFRRIVPFVGWSLAVFQHFLWNTSLLLIDGLVGRRASIFKVLLIQAPLFVLPPLIVLVVIARISARKELQILSDELRPEVDNGALTRDEYAILTSNHLRKLQTAWSRAHGGREQVERQRRFFQTAAELAFEKRALARGARRGPASLSPDVYRAELAALRMQMTRLGERSS
jgi:RsiW-degrading membrane proteinase PrsW (M82 family)